MDSIFSDILKCECKHCKDNYVLDSYMEFTENIDTKTQDEIDVYFASLSNVVKSEIEYLKCYGACSSCLTDWYGVSIR